MKKSLMLYLFILAILMNVFTYAFYSGEVKFAQNRYDKTTKKLRDSINLVKTQSILLRHALQELKIAQYPQFLMDPR